MTEEINCRLDFENMEIKDIKSSIVSLENAFVKSKNKERIIHLLAQANYYIRLKREDEEKAEEMKKEKERYTIIELEKIRKRYELANCVDGEISSKLTTKSKNTTSKKVGH